MELDTGNTAWIIIASSLVLLMTPGLAFFYGGMVRGKSVLNMMMMSFGAIGVVGIIWVLWGYSGTFGTDIGGFVGNPLQYFGLESLTDEESLMAASGVPALVAVGFQATFAIITVALISGAIADRTKFGSWLVFVAIWVTFVYVPIAHMVWGGGLLGADGDHQRPVAADRLRRRHRRAHQRRHRGPGPRAGHRQAPRLRPRADAPAQPAVRHARRRAAVVRLVRLQRRLRVRRGRHRRPRLDQHAGRHLRRDARLAA